MSGGDVTQQISLSGGLAHWLIWGWLGWWLIWARAPNPALWAAAAVLLANLGLAWWSWHPHRVPSLTAQLLSLQAIDTTVSQIGLVGQPAFTTAWRYDTQRFIIKWRTDLVAVLAGLSAGVVVLFPYLLIWQFKVLTSRWAPLALLAAIVVQLTSYLMRQPPLWTILTYPLLIPG